MAEFIWLSEALEDSKQLHAFIEPHSPAAASRAVDALRLRQFSQNRLGLGTWRKISVS